LRTYEFMYIVDPELEQEALEELTSRIERMITDAGGEVLRLRSWGRRRLAFPIRRFHEGHYHVAYLQLEPSAIADLRGRLALAEEVIRYLLVRTEVVPGEAPGEAPSKEEALPVEEPEAEGPEAVELVPGEAPAEAPSEEEALPVEEPEAEGPEAVELVPGEAPAEAPSEEEALPVEEPEVEEPEAVELEPEGEDEGEDTAEEEVED